MANLVIVGAGQAAQTLIETLRKRGFEDPIILIGEEPLPPYRRPPLSKAYMMGEMPLQELRLRPDEYYDEHHVELRLGLRVERIDRVAKTVGLSDGSQVAYGKLALTTGTRARRLPASIGGELPGVHVVRNLADVDAIAPHLVAGRRLLVVGGGYVGLEAAAVAAKAGMETTLVEREGRILSRIAAEETADYFRDLHLGHGVALFEGVNVERLEAGPDGALCAALLDNGERVETDLVIAGIGAVANDELAAAAGLAVDDGILVDATCVTSDPNIISAGDCARFDYFGASVRLESVQNAMDQAVVAAKAMMGEEVSYVPQPWFWSDQFDVKLQIAGLFKVGNRDVSHVVVRSGAREGSQSHWYFYEDSTGDVRFCAVDAMNEPRAYMMGRRWLARGLTPDRTQLADPSVPLQKVPASS